MKPKTYLSLLLIISISLKSFTQIDFGPQQIIISNAGGGRSVYACDIDNDGDNDVLTATARWVHPQYYAGDIAWYENTDGAGTFGTQQVITTQLYPSYILSVYACDIDGDGDMDVLSSGVNSNTIAWYKNTNGTGSFGNQQVITIHADEACDVYACDIDSDGDMDVLSASSDDDKIAWYENIDSAGTFGPQQIITTNADGASSVYACDIDSDGDMDVLSASENDDKIAWYKNTDGVGSFGSQQIISASAYYAHSVYACDVDSDGDMDVLSGTQWLHWYENTDGVGTYGPQQNITLYVSNTQSVYACDIDDDGDMDVLSASMDDDKIAWYENTDGQGAFGTQQIITTSADGAISVYATDIDGDGDMDVLSASTYDQKIAWYENLGSLVINEKPQKSFNVYPNPTTGVLTIQADFTIAQIEIYDQLGQLVLSNINKNTIDISTISQGLYFCKIKDNDENTGTQKVVKK